MLDDVASRPFSNFQGLGQDSRLNLCRAGVPVSDGSPGCWTRRHARSSLEALSSSLEPAPAPGPGLRALCLGERGEPVLALVPHPRLATVPQPEPPMQSLTSPATRPLRREPPGPGNPMPVPAPVVVFSCAFSCIQPVPSRPVADAARPTRRPVPRPRPPSPVPRTRAHTARLSHPTAGDRQTPSPRLPGLPPRLRCPALSLPAPVLSPTSLGSRPDPGRPHLFGHLSLDGREWGHASLPEPARVSNTQPDVYSSSPAPASKAPKVNSSSPSGSRRVPPRRISAP